MNPSDCHADMTIRGVLTGEGDGYSSLISLMMTEESSVTTTESRVMVAGSLTLMVTVCLLPCNSAIT